MFKRKFIKSLKIPPKIKDLNLTFPNKATGFIRLNKFKIEAIYLDRICDDKMLKFQYRNFHYVKPDFWFKRIYMGADENNIENTYDANMNLDSKYLLNQGNCVLNKNGVLEGSSFKIEENGKIINSPYDLYLDILAPIPHDFTCKVINNITENFDAKFCNIWMRRRDSNKHKNILYLAVGHSLSEWLIERKLRQIKGKLQKLKNDKKRN